MAFIKRSLCVEYFTVHLNKKGKNLNNFMLVIIVIFIQMVLIKIIIV